MSTKTIEIYRCPNGDRWLLGHDFKSGRLFVRHEVNAPSGGQVTDSAIGAFLSTGRRNPEHQALRLIAALIRDGT